MDVLIVAKDMLVRCGAQVLVNWREDNGALKTTLVCGLDKAGEIEVAQRRVDLAPGDGIVGRLLSEHKAASRRPLGSPIDKAEAIHEKFVSDAGLNHLVLLPCDPLGPLLGCTALYFTSEPRGFSAERAFAGSDLLTLLKREQHGSQVRSTWMAVAQAAANSYHDISQETYLARATIQTKFGTSPSRWPSGLQAIESKLKTIDKMTEELNALLKEGLEPTTSKVDVVRLLTDIKSDFQDRFDATNVVLDVHAAGQVRCRVNRGLMRRSVSNLLDNALTSVVTRYDGTTGGVVQIRARDSGEQVVIEIEDNGIGIDPAQINAVWNVGHTTKTDNRRSKWGLGLGQVRSFAEAAGGIALVDSDWGNGATFSLRIPKNGG